MAYAHLAEGRNDVQMAELQSLLAGPAEQERILNEMNRRSQQALMATMQPLVPPRR